MEKKKPVPAVRNGKKVISLAEHRERKRNEGPCNGFCLICSRVNECDEFQEQLEQEWSEELAEISREEGEKEYTVTLSLSEGQRFIDALKETLLFQFVHHRAGKRRSYVSTDKETVSRLMVAELMDLEINFSFHSRKRPAVS